ncbi:GntR family transcriptional regulator [Arthrobacter sp. 9MFCol3.1]|uniref:GntR family transcriptional regulator n=1 Tax=Arthrobacter sp. 9MFCol3.1 TaxID=1150398 RepID=UPI000686B6DB|nr:GntR family transcriptional regulator [Arthrobacter sp. 9MFCol3.1]
MSAEATAADSSKVLIPTMADAVVQRLRALIVSGKFRPGDRLVEERLAEMFGVSRPPLREALRILQRDGLVQSLPRRGFIVIPITAEDIREIYSLRFALERMAVELGMPVQDQSRLQPMRDALEDMRVAAEEGNDEAVVEANSRFHLALVSLPGHKRLINTYEGLRLQLELCMGYNLKFREQLFGDRKDVHPRHAQLLESIEKGDKEAVLYEIAHHGNRSFLDNLDDLIGPVR